MRKEEHRKRVQKHCGRDRLISMLDVHRVNHFRYDAREILERANIDPRVGNPILASIVTKASRSSIAEAREFIIEKQNEGAITPEVGEALFRLLNQYKRWR